ncbi:MAG: helix-turn-helix domain-containing protein [Acidimicrobiales bacterium]|nr:helix-turn-helix domain-containing protein [Acidimicrobiales bacterium]
MDDNGEDRYAQGADGPSRTVPERRDRTRPEQRPAERVLLDGSGAYRRDLDGVWRYTADGTAVPGAVDVVLGDLYDPATTEDPNGRPVRVVPRAWILRRPGHPLLWVLDHAEPGVRRAPVLVPVEAWEERVAQPVGLLAPELHPSQLLGIDDVAALLDVTASTVRAYLTRNQLPPPVAKVGGSPVWSRPVVERWASGRRTRRRVRPDP